VLGDFPSCLSRLARSSVFFSGMVGSSQIVSTAIEDSGMARASQNRPD
jgi:hypothetical protein